MKKERTKTEFGSAISEGLIWLIKLYQVVLSPIFGRQCRFEPSCSNYAIEAIRQSGLLKGGFLAVKRLLRCHPFGPQGYDPPPTEC